MKSLFSVAVLLILLISCNTDSINDKSKRNENWAWWVDAKTGKGSWIPVGDRDQIQDKGSYSLFYPDGNLFERGKLNDGKHIDTIFGYDLNGQLYCYRIIPDSVWHYLKNGVVNCYYQSGKISASGIVENHVWENKWNEYYENGRIKKILNLSNGRGWKTDYYENGNLKDSFYVVSLDTVLSRKEWYEDGTLKFEEGLKDGIQNGIVKTYYENGKVEESDETYINGVLNGTVKHYYENGKIEQTTPIIEGKREGLGYFYYETGTIKAVITFKDGDKKKFKVYDENGRIKNEGNWLNGKPDGDVRHYNEDGKLIAITHWKDGSIVNSTTYTP